MQLETRFGLNDNQIVDDHVQALVGERLILIEHFHTELARYSMFTGSQLALEGQDIEMLREPKPQVIVYLEERADY